MVTVAMGWGDDAFLWTGDKENERHHIHPALWQHLHGARGVQDTHSLIDWVILGLAQ